jgi:signal peptidase II
MVNQQQQDPATEPSRSDRRRVLVAYPIRYARQDENGRLYLDPEYATDRPAAAGEPEEKVQSPAGDRPAPPANVPFWELSLLLVVGAIVILLDQMTKRFIETSMPLYTESIPVEALFPYFRFTHTANYGAAFGMFQNGGVIFGIIAAIVAIAILIYNFGLPPGQRLLRFALGLQLGGALGNLIDRLRLGYVTDFLDVDVSTIVDIPYVSDWPIFNLADMAIVSGVAVLAFLMFTMEEPAPGEEPEPEPAAQPTVRILPGDE